MKNEKDVALDLNFHILFKNFYPEINYFFKIVKFGLIFLNVQIKKFMNLNIQKLIQKILNTQKKSKFKNS